MAKRVVAIIGAAGTGKSTLAKGMERDYGAQRLAIADGVRRVAALSFGEEIWKSLTYVIGDDGRMTGREVLQAVGAAMRSFDKYFWLRPVSRDIEANDGWPIVVIDDVRLVDEAQYLRNRHNAFVVLLVAPREVRAGRKDLSGEEDATEIEWQTVKPDLVIDTSDTGVEEALRLVAKEVLS